MKIEKSEEILEGETTKIIHLTLSVAEATFIQIALNIVGDTEMGSSLHYFSKKLSTQIKDFFNKEYPDEN